MARRAARAEMEIAIAEDPLRAQNRMLSALVIVVLAVLVAVVIWATGRTSGTPLIAGGVNLDVPLVAENPGTSQPQATSAALLINTPIPTATDLPAVLQARGSIAFVGREDGQTDIWGLQVGSRTPIRLTNSPEDERDPAWSPDGRLLAYASNKERNWDIYILDVLTGEERRMTFNLAFEANPTWSPDGQFIAYESYSQSEDGESLDIFVMNVDGSAAPVRLPGQTGNAEFSPAWLPTDTGRLIAYAAWVNGALDIFVYSLDDSSVMNLTNTPDRHEDYPAWSPDGQWIAYSALDEGSEKIFIKRVDNPAEEAIAFRIGRTPNWSPDGSSLIFALDTREGTQLIVAPAPFADEALLPDVIPVPFMAYDPVWSPVPLPAALINQGGQPDPITEPLYVEQVRTNPDDPFYGLDAMVNVDTSDSVRFPPFLNDQVNDSFNALRERVLAETGVDFFGEIDYALWDINFLPEAGVPNMGNWHKAGRAFSFSPEIILGFPRPIEVVREDGELTTGWRVYVRVAEDAQAGLLGEPLRRMPWAFPDMLSQPDAETYNQGGRLQAEIPSGYYVDITQIAEDYGWQPLDAGSNWRANAAVRNYWTFYRPDGLTWYEAMRELYTEGQLVNFAPTPTPGPLLPTATPEEG
jgi:TolB protein